MQLHDIIGLQLDFSG